MELEREVSARHVLTILAVEDAERSAAFSERAFGWKRAVSVPVYVELELPAGMRLGLYERRSFGRNTGQVPFAVPPGELAPCELYLHVDDLEAAIDRLRAAGARELSPRGERDWGDEAAYFADPSGNVVVVAVSRATAERGAS
jgi:catechol 2,3-dioxygenase-like lactoylglutathione lyase family enzyme